jgi:biopolymer transport protein ExbD
MISEPLRRRVLVRRKCRPSEAIGVTLEMAMAGFVLTMLITVMVIDGTEPHHSGFPADMAKAKHVDSMPSAKREDAIRVVVTRDGAVYLGHTEIRVGELAEQIHQKLRSGSERRAYLMVDQRTKYWDVEPVVDAIRGTGIWNIGLLVEQDYQVGVQR